MRNSGTKYSKWSNVVSYADYLVTAHIARVAQQGGTIDSPALLNLYVQYLVSNNLMSSQYIGAIPSVTGYKIQAATTQNCQIVFSVDPAGSKSGAYIGDMSQATLLNQPKLLKYSGEKYLWSSGVAGNWVDCSSSANTQFTDDIEIIMKVNVNLTLGGQQRFFGQYSTGHATHYTGLDYYVGNIRFYLDSGNIIATTPNWFTDSVDSWIKVTRTASTGNVVFYKSSDGTNWTVQATVIGLTSGTIIPSTAGISIGSDSDTGGAGLQGGKVYKATFSKVIGGTPTVNFDFTNYNPAVSETTWTATTGETWTLNTSAGNTVNHSTIVTRTSLVYKENLSMESANFNTTANDGGITRFYIKKFQSGTVAQGGNHFRCAVAGAEASNGSYYVYQSTIIEGTDTIYCSDYFTGQIYTYGTEVIQNKSLLLTSRKRYGVADSLQVNKNIRSAPDTLNNVPSTWHGDADSYALGTMAGVKQGHITFGGILPDLTISAFQDFLNTTIFNGEIY
jgi:hypothetical protein